jgi:hypothetical protein
MYISDAVQNGIDMLHDHFGGNSWLRRVDVPSLDQSEGTKCVLGQVFGTYSDGLQELFGDRYYENDWEQGYYHMNELDGSELDLTREWKQRISSLQAMTLEPTGITEREHGESIMKFTIRFTGTTRLILTNQQIGQLYIEASKQNTTVEELLEDMIGTQASNADYNVEV